MKRSLMTLTALLMLITACAPAQKNVTPMPSITPPQVVMEKPAQNPDSLFDPGEADFLFADNRARRVGDIVLVNIVETSEATNKATTKTERDSSINVGVENFFGQSSINALPIKDAFGVGKNLGPSGNVGTTPLIKAGVSNSYDGDGETTRESNVTATIAARVLHVLPNDVLQVAGARQVRVNGETQIIALQGLIRSRDIGPNNSITSNYLADAKIEYYGEGVVADKQRPGWLTRVLDNVWPF